MIGPEQGIIEYNKLISLAIDQAPKGEGGRLLQLDGVDLDQVKEMRIEFQNIISLEQLWPLKHINKLILSHNCIEKISKLDCLAELQVLDLSFNRIQSMEGLNNLIKLEVLILSGNEIEKIHGIDNLARLNIFSIANNKIGDSDHVMYLRNFKNLRSLNIQGNPCTEKQNYMDYVIAFIPQLTYFSYRMISRDERNCALAKYRLSIAKIEESDMNSQRDLGELQTIQRNRSIDLAAFIEDLKGNNFFDLLFRNNEDIPAGLGEDHNLETINNKHKMNICKLSNEIYQFGEDEQVRRTSEIGILQDTIINECAAIKVVARRLMDHIEELRNEITMRGKNSVENYEALSIDNFESIMKKIEEFNELLSVQWTTLMYNQVVLHEQIQDLIEGFRHNMSGMIDEAITYIKNKFCLMWEAEMDYNQRIIDEIGDPEDAKGGQPLMELHNDRLNLIRSRENTMLERMQSWFMNFMLNLQSNEDSRHRSRILEISHFFQFQRGTLQVSLDLLRLNTDKDVEVEVKALLNE